LGTTNITRTGFTVVETGGEAYSGVDEANKALIIGDDNNAVIALTDGSLSLNNSGYELDGEATLYGLKG
jgi:hypothetical protein